MRLKKWHYLSATHPDFYLCAAIADLGYVGNTFCYLVDRRSGRKFETESLRPLGWGVQVGGNSRAESLARGIRIAHLDNRWLCELDLNLEGKSLRAEVSFPACTGGTETATYAGVGTASSGTGKLLYSGALSPTISISTGVTPKLTTSSTITED